MPIPKPDPLDEYFPTLSRMVAKTSWFPHPDTVSALGSAVFPTSRARKERPRFSNIMENGQAVGMYDDNATPEWAVFWSHKLRGTRPKGWTIAHVWPLSDDMNCYTNLANLALVPESFSGLTDKNGALTGFLRWHAWVVYNWKPDREEAPKEPIGYNEIAWRYLDRVNNPGALIRQTFASRNNQRTRILSPIMKSRGML